MNGISHLGCNLWIAINGVKLRGSTIAPGSKCGKNKRHDANIVKKSIKQMILVMDVTRNPQTRYFRESVLLSDILKPKIFYIFDESWLLKIVGCV